MENTKILVCLSCNARILSQPEIHYDRRKGLPGSWLLYKCQECGIMAVYPSPSEVEISDFYSVYSRDRSVTFSLSFGSGHPFLRKMFHWISGVVDPRDFIKPEPNSLILDYGCGEAGCLFDFHARGFKISGAEISSGMVGICKKAGLDVHQVTSPDKIPFDDNSFDIVYLMQVFEHIRNPHIFLDELLRILKPGGNLFLAVPNSKSIWRKVFGKNWVSGYFLPFHLFQYDSKSLSRLAYQHEFRVMKSWSRTPESWFRLNLKACMFKDEMLLDERQAAIDSIFIRIPLMFFLRMIELLIPQGDCLVMKLIKLKPEISEL